MFLKKRRETTDPRVRSLLQKAVRRGAPGVVQATVRHLLTIGDRTWLRSRAVVITLEEAWPLAKSLVITKDDGTKLSSLLRVARSTKQKDAAGLGALAFAFHEGDRSMEDLVPSARYLRLVSEAVDRPPAFFQWALSQCTSDSSTGLVDIARQYLAAATWGWDKATILAGALLAALCGVPELPLAETADSEFPFWVALDKHTPEGKEALRRVGVRYGEQYRKLIWAGFYCESTTVNALTASPWFEAERKWRLRKAGLTVEAAKELWDRVRPILQAELSAAAEDLRERILTGSARRPEKMRLVTDGA